MLIRDNSKEMTIPSQPPHRRKDPIKITGLTRFARGVRRWWSSVEWAVTWLGLPRQKETATQPGLILVQIDGLSLVELESAIARQEMPFLASLAEGSEYRLGPCYSGLPSNWAAAQAELLYGVKTVVPGSRYYDRSAQQVVHVIDPATARAIEVKLAADHVGLLHEGSSYCNLLGGGACDEHFCGTSVGWSDSFRSLHPLKVLSAALLHLGMWIRGGFQVCRELSDLLLTPDPRVELTWWQKLTEIPGRVVATVFLRELSTLGACYDAARGTRIIQVNFLGYDEQAHRFGPQSRRARRQLRAIDRSLRRLWRAAHLGSGREFDVWIFSTHGQEATLGSNPNTIESLRRAISEKLEKILPSDVIAQEPLRVETRTTSKSSSPRSTWFGWNLWAWFGHTTSNLTPSPLLAAEDAQPDVLVVPSGTVAHVYLLSSRTQRAQAALAQELSKNPLAPLVVTKPSHDSTTISEELRVWTDGQLRPWPLQAVRLLGAAHRHLGHLVADLPDVVRHPDAGDLVVFGWSGIGETINYLGHAGGHNGLGSEETTGFVLMPSDVFATLDAAVAPRPADLRNVALRVLDSLPLIRVSESTAERAPAQNVELRRRILTYNIHGCVGMDGELAPQRIARVIGQSQAEVVCLQEIDRRRPRSQNIDQLQVIADALGMKSVFAAAWEDGEQAFGNAILTTLPFTVVKTGLLQRQKATRNGRSAIWIEIEDSVTGDRDGANGTQNVATRWQFISTHLSIYPSEQCRQSEELVRDWLKPALARGPVVLCGDFNAAPKSASWKVLAACLRDVEHGRSEAPYPTYFSPYPLLRVDHIFVSPTIRPASQVIRSRLAKIASDHLPVMAELTVPSE
jgi:endonuclease/exonuclease/phosphatase family metal-dependent hydrolase